MNGTRDQIRRYIVENMLFGEDSPGLTDDTSLLDEGIVDSTGVVELVLFAEDRFAISVDSDEIVPENFDSIASLATYIARKTE